MSGIFYILIFQMLIVFLDTLTPFYSYRPWVMKTMILRDGFFYPTPDK